MFILFDASFILQKQRELKPLYTLLYQQSNG